MPGPVPALDPSLGPCMLWPGSKGSNGYGQVIVTRTKRGPRVYVHRLMWSDAHGPIGAGLDVHHRCNVPACARVEHLEAVTHQANMLATPNNAAARNAARTTCGRCGEPYDDVDYRGRRVCRPCRRERQAEYRARKAAR